MASVLIDFKILLTFCRTIHPSGTNTWHNLYIPFDLILKIPCVHLLSISFCMPNMVMPQYDHNSSQIVPKLNLSLFCMRIKYFIEILVLKYVCFFCTKISKKLVYYQNCICCCLNIKKNPVW